jgi:lincosamide nucleotidyltransferase A/C/D/E
VDSRQVLAVVELLRAEGVVGWLDGGWGVDALLHEQTRSHADVDLVVDVAGLDRLVGSLRAEGYPTALTPRRPARPQRPR